MRRLGIALNSVRRESAKGAGYAVHWFLARFYFRFVRPHCGALPKVTSADRARPLTVVVPAAEKDAPVLPLCLRAAKELIQHPLKAVLVVAPDSRKIREIAAAERCEYVAEDEVLPQPAAALRCRGWVLQQLIKFNAALYVPTDDYLVLDADTVFLRPQAFFRGGSSVLRYSDQYELLYNRSLELAFGHNHRFPVSFVTHHMLFNSAIVKGLLARMEQRFRRPWHEAIVYEMDRGHPVSFSEYELYGHHVMSQPALRRTIVLEYWRGLDRKAADLPQLEEVRSKTCGRLNSVSFHWHTQ